MNINRNYDLERSATQLSIHRTRSRAVILLAALSVLLLFGNADADRSMRCNGRIISVGADIDEVFEKCGQPDRRKAWEEGYPGSYTFRIFDYETERYLAPKLIKGPIRMERWTYDFGPTWFKRYLYFQNEELIRIETGEKGSG